jgi:nucleoside-diphosphate kinase
MADLNHRRGVIMERSLVLIKPDAVERRLIGQIISIYETKGLNIAALKMIKPSQKIAEEHYIEHQAKPFFKELVTFLTRGKVCAFIIEGDNVIKMVRKINGATDPAEAEMGTIRGQFAMSKSENIVHASDSVESAEREIKIWFAESAG